LVWRHQETVAALLQGNEGLLKCVEDLKALIV
jgi:hypothetical protein